MTDYTKLVEALRLCQFGECGCGKCYYKELKGDWCTEDNHPEFFDCDDKLKLDAADAIETLNRLVDLNTERCEGLREQLRKAQEQYEKHLNELEQKLPKRGEWVEENRRPRSSQFVCSECHRTAYDPQPTRDKAWRKRCRYAYCPNCGAKMED